MNWSWQNKHWPKFKYDSSQLTKYEAAFMYQSGVFMANIKHIQEKDKVGLRVELLSQEALKSSAIEGELLDRDSLQSSIRKNFGLSIKQTKTKDMENGMAEMMIDLYKNYAKPLSHRILYKWNTLILYGANYKNLSKYRDDDEPMQIVSGAIHNPKIHYEAPPANQIDNEMNNFISWFNMTSSNGDKPLSPLIRAGIAHLYFVLIHPFADGNGRIARAISEKVLAQSLGQASLISLSLIIEKYRKKYYANLDYANKDLDITEWLKYFATTILAAQEHSQQMLEFLINKTKFYDKYSEQLNDRQAKVIARIFAEGSEGFKGGLSVKNYIAISQTSRATASRDLQDLVDMGILRQEGKLKTTRYYLDLPQFMT